MNTGFLQSHRALALIVAFSLVAAPASALEPPPLKPGERIAIGAAIEPASIRPGQSAEIIVAIRLAPGHHIYALDSKTSGVKPTAFDLKLPPGLALDGTWKGPEPKKIFDGSRVYENTAIFRQRVIAAASAARDAEPGERKIPLNISFQVCNPALCFPPEKISRELNLEVLPGGGAK